MALVRAYANIADELDTAGYSTSEIHRIKEQADHYLKVREIVRKASGETLDLKAYEADMRHLIDTYIEADEPREISPFDGMSLLELIVKTGIYEAIDTQLGGFKESANAVAEIIENNVRSKILKGCFQTCLDSKTTEKTSRAGARDEMLNTSPLTHEDWGK